MDKLGNEELEMEYVASKLLSGIILPNDYIEIRSLFSKIPIIDTPDEVTSMVEILKKSLTSNLNLLNDSEISNYYYGNNKEIVNLVYHIHNRASLLIPTYDTAIDEKLELEALKMEQNIQGQDYAGIGQAIDSASFENDEIRRLNDVKLQLINLKGVTESLLNLYGSSTSKIPSKSINTDLSAKYRLFLLSLSNNLGEISSNVVLSSVMGRIFDSLGVMIPQNNLDPFKVEKVNNVIDTLTHPKDYYKDCKTGQIVGAEVGDTFCKCYPAFGQEFLSLYLEDYESMTFQEQINFRKCFSLPADDSQLLQLTNTYIKMSYT